jgi:hypothetical protein
MSCSTGRREAAKPKTGKTAGACTTKTLGGVVLLNADLPNATHYPHSLDSEGRIMEVEWDENPLQTLVDITTAIIQQTGMRAPANRVAETVILDPLSEMHRRLIEGLAGSRMRPTLDQYGDAAIHLERFCRKMCELPVNFVIVAHDRAEKDEATGAFERLALTATNNQALGSKLMGMVDVIGFTGVKQIEDGSLQYLSQLAPGAGRRGGDRFDVLGSVRTTDVGDWISVINEAGAAAPAADSSPAEADAAVEPAAEAGESEPPPEPKAKPARRPRRDIVAETHAAANGEHPENGQPTEEARAAAQAAQDELDEAAALAEAETQPAESEAA